MPVPSSVRFSPHRQDFAIRLFQEGAIKFSTTPLRIVGSSEEPSPVYLNLHTRHDPKPGPLSEGLLRLIGELLHEDMTIKIPCDYFLGDPSAGEPIAASFMRARGISRRRYMHVEKREVDGRWTKHMPPEFGPVRSKSVMLFDDRLTHATGKIATIELLKSFGYTVPVVVVVIDRGQGGSSALLEAGVRVVFSLFSLGDLLWFYRSREMITERMYESARMALNDT